MPKTNEGLSALSNSLAEAVQTGGAATLTVDARPRFPASGVAYVKDLVLTASHVVHHEEAIKVSLPDGEELSAELLGRDPHSDLALLRLAAAKAKPAQPADGEANVGQLALALGRPSAEGVQASLGIVSAKGAGLRTRHGARLDAYLRTDAIPYPGFSGGPLVDVEGRVLGVNTSGLGYGASMTIPATLAWTIAAAIQEHGSLKRGFLGVRSQMVELPAEGRKALKREQVTGLLIAGIESGSPAAEGGLMVGDILVGIAGHPTPNHEDLIAQMSGEVVGKPTPLEVLRGGNVATVSVTIGERPAHNEGRHAERHGRRGHQNWGRR
jgi:S1-C subfamily serine protease